MFSRTDASRTGKSYTPQIYTPQKISLLYTPKTSVRGGCGVYPFAYKWRAGIINSVPLRSGLFSIRSSVSVHTVRVHNVRDGFPVRFHLRSSTPFARNGTEPETRLTRCEPEPCEAKRATRLTHNKKNNNNKNKTKMLAPKAYKRNTRGIQLKKRKQGR